MGSTSASVLIGWMHQNDGDICPTHLAQLIEGDSAVWSLHDLGETPAAPVLWLPQRPERIFADLLALIAVHVLDHPAEDPRFTESPVRPEPTDTKAINALGKITRARSGLALSATISEAAVCARPTSRSSRSSTSRSTRWCGPEHGARGRRSGISVEHQSTESGRLGRASGDQLTMPRQVCDAHTSLHRVR